ncbi:MAG TPA: GNAT family N-acetyltransferase [Tepidisphaeraceae bacterium]|nr:GNAT family N-acetyltransferase [Tepidisphaeraceae bacterium]
MGLNLRWVGDDERDRVGETRALCYGRSSKEVAQYVEGVRQDGRAGPGDWLLAERDGAFVGTATALPMTMWVRGGAVPCQGVAYVGTVKTHRRRTGNDPGIGTALMRETLRAARERGQVVSALMPFRGSYYEHFGYGIVERRAEWTVPLAVMPAGDFETVGFYDAARDRDALVQCRQRVAQRGQADVERSPGAWEQHLRHVEETHFLVVDRHGDGPVRGWISFEHLHDPAGPDTVKVNFDTGYEDVATLRRFLHFLASLRDQYTYASIQLPRDLPLNLLLKEPQMTHRANRNHPTPEMRPFTRMQVRVLDHARLLSSMRLPHDHRPGKVVVAIRETEGTLSKLAIEMSGGTIAAAATDASADVEMPDRTWGIIALGDLSATRAAELGLINVTNRAPLGVLDALAQGPAPFCREYF